MSDKLVFDHYPLEAENLPQGWQLTTIGQIAKLVASGFPCGEHNDDGRGVPHVRPMNIDREGRFDLTTTKYVDGEIPRELANGDVLFNNTNSPELIGKTTAVLVDTRLAYSNHMTRIRVEDGLNPVFVARQLHLLWMSGYFRHRCVNHVNQASISAEPLSETVPLLIAPTQEQARIADAIDELLSDLDAGVAALERVQAKLARYRAAVLKAAVEGELTSDWRERNPTTETGTELVNRILIERRRRWEEEQLRKFKNAGKEPPKNWKAKYKEPVAPVTTDLPELPKGWCWVTIDQVLSEPIVNGISVKGSDHPPGIPALRLNAMTESGFDYTARRYLPLEPEQVDDLWIETNDFFVSRGNGSKKLVGRGTVAQEPPERLIFPDTMMRLRLLNGPIQLSWIPTIWSSGLVRQQIERLAKTTAGILKISQPDVSSIVVPIPGVNEQEAIIEVIEDQLSVIEHLEADLSAKLKASQALRQSILRDAFTGKLVPQNPKDEPASDLLKRIASEREERERLAQAAKKLAKKPGRTVKTATHRTTKGTDGHFPNW